MCEVGRYQLEIVRLTSIRTYTNTLGSRTSFLGTDWTLFHFEVSLGERLPKAKDQVLAVVCAYAPKRKKEKKKEFRVPSLLNAHMGRIL